MELCVLIPSRHSSRPRLRELRCCVALALLAAAACTAPGVAFAAKAEKQVKVHKENRRSESHEIEGLEDQWRAAMTSSDIPMLEKLLADDFLAISANGTLSDKRQYLQRIESRENAFSSIEPLDIKVRILPGTAVVTSQVRVIGQLNRRPMDGVYRYTKVYRRGPGGQWVVLNFEATRVSGGRGDETEMHPGMPLNPGSLSH